MAGLSGNRQFYAGFAMLKTPKPENGREDMMTDDPMELHKMRTRRIARIVSWITGVLLVAFWVSFLMFRFDDKYLVWTPFFMIFLFMPRYLKRYLNPQGELFACCFLAIPQQTKICTVDFCRIAQRLLLYIAYREESGSKGTSCYFPIHRNRTGTGHGMLELNQNDTSA
jgi:hypothetical protein